MSLETATFTSSHLPLAETTPTKSSFPIKFALLCDATASMDQVIASAKKCLSLVLKELSEATTGEKQFALGLYRDYGNPTLLNINGIFSISKDHTNQPQFTANPKPLLSLLNRTVAQGGDDIPEALECILALTTKLPWKNTQGEPPCVKTVYLACDAPPHALYNPPKTNTRDPDAYPTVEELKTVHETIGLFQAFPCLSPSNHPEDWFTQIIQLSREGVTLNPIICTETDTDLIYFATFIALLTGGGIPVFLPSTDSMENFGNYLKNTSLLNFEELKQVNNPETFQQLQQLKDTMRLEYKMKIPNPIIIQAMSTFIKTLPPLYDPEAPSYEAIQKMKIAYSQFVQTSIEMQSAYTKIVNNEDQLYRGIMEFFNAGTDPEEPTTLPFGTQRSLSDTSEPPRSYGARLELRASQPSELTFASQARAAAYRRATPSTTGGEHTLPHML